MARAALSRLGVVRKQFRALQARSDVAGRDEALYFFSALDAPADARLKREAGARGLAIRRVRTKAASAVFRRGDARGPTPGATVPSSALFAGPILIVAPRERCAGDAGGAGDAGDALTLLGKHHLDFLTGHGGLVLLAGKIGGELMYPTSLARALRTRESGGAAHVLSLLRSTQAHMLALLRVSSKHRARCEV